MADLHLWFNGEDHSYGETGEEASRNAQAMWGLSAEEADGDGWVMVPDDELITDEDGARCGTAKERAESMAAFEQRRVAAPPSTGCRSTPSRSTAPGRRRPPSPMPRSRMAAVAESRREPGPWLQWNASGRKMVTTIKSADRTKICTLADGTDEWVNAHAHLISAAPELLEALKEALGSCDGDLCMHTWHDAARAAIAKAEGRADG